MANVAVTCIKNGRSDSFGRPLVSGTYYPSVEIETAKALWNSGYVSVADASVFDQDPLAGTSPLDDFNVARALSLSRQPAQTSANLAAELAAIGVPVPIWLCGMPFVLFAGDGASTGLAFTGTAGGFTLSATPMSGLFLTNGYAYLPANAGGLGNTAGWYYFTMSSETAGTVYNNIYTPGDETTPSIPAAPVPFSDASAVRITQETAEVTVLQRTLNAGSFSPNSIVTWTPKVHGDGSANAKQTFLRANGVSIYFLSLTTSPVMEPVVTMRNLGSLSRQLSTRASGSAGTDAKSSIAGEFTSIDTAQAVVLTASLKIAAAGTTAVLYPGAVSLAKGV